MTGLSRLAERYASRIPDAKALAASGVPVVGVVGSDLPRAIVTAAGGLALRLFWSDEPSEAARTEAFTLLGRGVDIATQKVLAAILDGEFDFLAGMVVTHDCQASLNLFYILRELERQGRIRIPVHFVDLVHLDRAPSLVFDTRQLARAAGIIASWTGRAIEPESLRAAMIAHREVDSALETLRRRRVARHPVVGGAAALHAFGVAAASTPSDAATFLREILDDLPEVGESAIGLRLYFTGSSPIGDALYLLLESQSIGGHPVAIVGEDHDWGELVLGVRPEIPDESAGLDALFSSLASALLAAPPAAPTSGQKARGVATRAAVSSSGASALLSIVREHDEAAAWDFPHQSGDAGVPAVLLAQQGVDIPASELAAALGQLGGAA